MNLFSLWINVWLLLLMRFFLLFLAQMSSFLCRFFVKFLFLSFEIWSSTFPTSTIKTVSTFYRYYIKTNILFFIFFMNYFLYDFLIERHWIWKKISSGQDFGFPIFAYFLVLWRVNLFQGTSKTFGDFTNIKLVTNLNWDVGHE